MGARAEFIDLADDASVIKIEESNVYLIFVDLHPIDDPTHFNLKLAIKRAVFCALGIKVLQATESFLAIGLSLLGKWELE